ncbi:MAG: neurotransmitter-gated ion-channel ligand binding domain protein [Rhizobium sp.]|nr:neurotransmitter-gated ion-channel ligand binding domain protein [Rhizobium sp.]
MRRLRPLVARRLAVLIAWLALFFFAATAMADTPIPQENGLPVNVDVGVAFVDLLGFDENAGTFRATIDLRLRWNDPRLRNTSANVATPPQTFTDKAALDRIGNMWIVPLVIANQRGNALASSYGLRLYPNGGVELIHRITADFDAEINVGKFPFDRQKLAIEAKVDGLPLGLVTLRFGQPELDFSRPARDARIAGWTVGLVDLRSDPVPGWYNVAGGRVIASLEVTRQPGLIVASIFIPLLASLFIPLLAMWLNRIEDGVFQVDTFELVNIIIGGLFAVIALNFTVYSTYVVLADGDNTVNRLFALNYLALAGALVVNITFARFNLLAHIWGPWVQEQTYYVLMWLIPVMVLVLAAAFLLTAYM